MMHDNVPHRIRVVEPDDGQLLAAVRLGVSMWDESTVYASLPRSVDKMIEFAYHMRADPLSFFEVAVDAADTCHGYMIGSLADYGFSDAMFAYDRLLYVTQNMRGSVAARMLITAFETWARYHGAQRVLLGVTTGVHTERTEQFYNKLGYATVGRLTMKEI